jgi:glycine dehydrogenase subunit 1
VMMATRVTKRGKAVFSGGLHPHYIETSETLAHAAGVTTTRMPYAIDDEAAVIGAIDSDTACVVVQTPNVFGTVTDVSKIAEAAHAAGALLVVVTTEAVSFGLLKSPGEMGADIAVAEGQSIGVGLNFGGPYVGLFATRDKFVRQMPGRLCGETVDAEGRRGFVLTLSTREQHIRRDKATSNICTNSGLCALAFSIHMTLLGEVGLRRLAAINHAKARKLVAALSHVEGVEVLTPRYFNEIAVRLPHNAVHVVELLAQAGILGGVPFARLAPGMDDVVLLAATETVTDTEIEVLARVLSRVLSAKELTQ